MENEEVKEAQESGGSTLNGGLCNKRWIMMFAVMVKPAARKRICTRGLVWVKDDRHEFYVSLKERGVWPTKAEAEKMIKEPWEVVVEVCNA